MIRIGVLANRGDEMCLAEWDLTADYLSAELKSWRFEIVPLDFDEVRHAVEVHAIQFLLVNPSMYVALEYRGLVSRIATFQQPSPKGGNPLPVFGGVIFSRSDRNDINRLNDLKGKRFAAVARDSLGGWHAAWREFREAGIQPEKDFAELVYLGTHDAVVEAVLKGEVDAGTVRSTQLERMASEGKIDLRAFHILHAPSSPPSEYQFLLSTRLYPEWPFAAVKGTELGISKLVASALLRMKPDDPAAMASRGAGWAIPLDYASVHECLRELNLPPYDHLGRLTFSQALSLYWPYLLAIAAILLAVTTLGSLAWRTSLRLKESLRALAESERKYRTVVENIQDIYYRLDAQGRILLVSPSAACHLGYASADELIGRKAEEFWKFPSGRTAFLEELNRSGSLKDFEFEIQRLDGSSLTAAATVQLVRDETGHPVGSEGILRDITDRKRAEAILLARLRLSEFARGRSLDDLLQRTVDEAERLTGSNIGFFHFLDDDQDTVLLQTWSTRTVQALCSAAGKGMHYPVAQAGVWVDCIRQGEPVIHNDYESLSHRKGMPPGHPQVLREMTIPIFRDERIVALLGVGNKTEPYGQEDIHAVSQLANLAWDIVVARQAEEALRRSEERFHSLFSNMAEGVAMHELLLDQDGHPVNYRIVDCNPQYERILGLRRDEVLGKLATDVYGTDDAPLLAEYSEVVLGETPAHLEPHIPSLNKDFEISIAPWGQNGFATIFTDITSRKLAEEERAALERHLVQVQKLESIGQLAGGVAHDLNNMLTPILGYTEMLLLDLSEGDAQRVELEQILQAAVRARDLTRQLLAFARKQTLEMRPIDLNGVIEGLERMLRRTLREDVSVRMNLAPSLGLFKGDVGQIEQIIINLAVNAQDAMPEGGTLTIETEEVLYDAPHAQVHEGMQIGPHVVMRVKDTGIGMDETTRQKIFDPFFTTKSLGRGTGLGLSTVYGIVKQHGGNIWVESEAGKGTVFEVSFPQTHEPQPSDGLAELHSMAQGSETVLVVEDQEQVRAMACGVLKRYGYNVLEAPDGESAIELQRSLVGPIHLLITDVIMTGMNGKELYERLSAERLETKVLYMSGYPSDAIGHHGVLDEAVHFIQKPFTLRDFTNKVREALDSH